LSPDLGADRNWLFFTQIRVLTRRHILNTPYGTKTKRQLNINIPMERCGLLPRIPREQDVGERNCPALKLNPNKQFLHSTIPLNWGLHGESSEKKEKKNGYMDS
jgi:hypothetical protein